MSVSNDSLHHVTSNKSRVTSSPTYCDEWCLRKSKEARQNGGEKTEGGNRKEGDKGRIEWKRKEVKTVRGGELETSSLIIH